MAIGQFALVLRLIHEKREETEHVRQLLNHDGKLILLLYFTLLKSLVISLNMSHGTWMCRSEQICVTLTSPLFY